jgi:hypothetical protein
MTALWLTVIGGGATAAWKTAGKAVRAPYEAALRSAHRTDEGSSAAITEAVMPVRVGDTLQIR